MLKKRLPFALLISFLLSLAVRGQEPSVALARLWWPEQYNVWSPVGWPDHYFKFAALYNGTVVVSPGVPNSKKPHAAQWANEDFQLTFHASGSGESFPMPEVKTVMREWEGGLGVQSWDADHEAPLLKTEFRSRDGVVLQSSMFAHIPGAADVGSGIEPEYLWIRVEVKHLDEYYHPDNYKMAVTLSRLFLNHEDIGKLSPDIGINPARAYCGRPLTMHRESDGYRVTEDDGRIRLGVFPEKDAGDVQWREEEPLRYNLILNFPAKVGAYVDLLFPALVASEEEFVSEASETFTGALEQADRYWATLRPATEAVFDVPEDFIDREIKENFRIARVLGEKDHVSGNYSYISGAWGYDAYWPTPGSMVSAMFMDPMGHFADTQRYLEVFAKLQGNRVAPGSSYKLHPGYFSTPWYLESVDWLTDHGAVMYMAATHALLSGDPAFIERWTEPLVRACDFIMEYSRTDHPGIPGLLPPGWSNDEEVPTQSVWILAWNYKGLSETIRLLKKNGHPRAPEFEAFRDEFKETFRREYRRAVEAGPRWSDSSGKVRFRPPSDFTIEDGSRFQTDGRSVGHTFMTDAFYLDTGPLCLVWAGLLHADDPVMVDMLDFFREGPNWQLHKPLPWSLDRAVLEHEMSSCEPCYSFNAFHSWQLGDRQHYLEAMYSILAGAVSGNTFISCEHRHGIQGTQFAFPLGFHLARLAVLDERISEGNLHLLRFCPLAWLEEGRPARFLRMPTEFGPVDLTAGLSDGGRTLEVTFSASWRDRPGEIILHVPPVPGLRHVTVNGKKYPASKGTITIKER